MSKEKQGPAINLIHTHEKPDEPSGEEPEEKNMTEIPEELFNAMASEEYNRIMKRLGDIERLLIKLVGMEK